METLQQVIARSRPSIERNLYTKSFLAVDTEGTGLDVSHKDYPFAVSACTSFGDVYFWQWDVDPYTRIPKVLQKDRHSITHLLANFPDIIFHNAKFDIQALSRVGIPIPSGCTVQDTSVAAHVLGEQKLSLKELAIVYLNIFDDDEEALQKAVVKARLLAKHEGIPRGEKVQNDYWLPRRYMKDYPNFTDILQTYAVRDAERTALLWKIFGPAVESEGLSFQYQREMAAVPMLDGMERCGVCLRVRKAKERLRDLSRKCAEITKRVMLNVGFEVNLRASADLRTLLFSVAEMSPVKYTPTGLPSTDLEVIAELRDTYQSDILDEIVAFKDNDSAIKYLKTYLAKVYEGRLRFHYNPVGTRTTRFSSSNPNGQNISKDAAVPLRDVFGPPRGWWWLDVDYNQLELRCFAVYARERRMLAAFANNEDLHQLTSDAISQEVGREVPRRLGKRVNFAWIYGAQPPKLARLIGVPARALSDALCKEYPDAVRWFAAVQQEVRREGFVTSGLGFRIPVAPNEAYKGVNYIIQSTAGDVLKSAMIRIDDYLQTHHVRTIVPLLTIHDELVFEIRNGTSEKHVRKLKQIMEESGKDVGVTTPVDVKRIAGGNPWTKAKPWRC